MRPALLAAALLVPAAAAAQDALRVWPLTPVDAFAAPTDRGVWTDMRPLSFKGTDEELQAATGSTLYAGPSDPADRDTWRAAHLRDGRVDCEDPATLCVVRVEGEAFVFPVSGPAERLRAVPGLRVSDDHAALLEPERMGVGLNPPGIRATAEGTRLLTSQPDRPDCSDPGVTCGVVFEVETTGYTLGLYLM